jgi:hypothetical protein
MILIASYYYSVYADYEEDAGTPIRDDFGIN